MAFWWLNVGSQGITLSRPNPIDQGYLPILNNSSCSYHRYLPTLLSMCFAYSKQFWDIAAGRFEPGFREHEACGRRREAGARSKEKGARRQVTYPGILGRLVPDAGGWGRYRGWAVE